MARDDGRPVNQTPPASERQDPTERASGGACELEARLDSLLSDPTVQLLMERDGVERDVLLRTVRLVRRRVREARLQDAL